MSTRTPVTIIKETRKAKLVQSDDGRIAWMQARWVRDDLTVNDKTFSQNAEEYAADQTAREEAKAYKEAYHPLGDIERESAKAVAIKAYIYEEHSDQQISRLAWIPKSQLNADGHCPGWLLNAKASQLVEENRMPAGGYYWVTMAGQNFY